MALLLFVQIVLFSLIARAPNLDAWGKEGHYMVCKIAEVINVIKWATKIDI